MREPLGHSHCEALAAAASDDKLLGVAATCKRLLLANAFKTFDCKLVGGRLDFPQIRV